MRNLTPYRIIVVQSVVARQVMVQFRVRRLEVFGLFFQRAKRFPSLRGFGVCSSIGGLGPSERGASP